MSLSAAVETDDLDWARLGRDGLSDDDARALRYMAATENHVVLYLRTVLTRFLTRDYAASAFLACWAYEEMQHGRALDRALTTCGRPPARARFEDGSHGAGPRGQLIATVARGVAELTPAFAATHMTWGAAQEMMAAAAYTQLAYRTRNHELSRLLLRLARDERRHQRFYYEQAARRLARSALARRLCRLGMMRLWAPVGRDVGGDAAELEFLSTLLHDNVWGRRELARIDRQIARLPGLAGFDRASRSVAHNIARYHKRQPAHAQAIRAYNSGCAPRFAAPADEPAAAE
ncbi:MAG: ferritin-like domain-containing protein [Myxococcales bacterium]|nr:hypothetical protein [Myxococcales bacterium]MCB9755791.1 ferritin-like domain-containing protein [Myxococcales bacterium]